MQLHPLIVDKNNLAELSGNIEDYPDGILIPVDKPYRWSSSDVVRKAKFAMRNCFGIKNIKVGHAGTLDPLATGVLVVCVGRATKLCEALQEETKEYIADFTLGATTPSFDREHPIDELFDTKHITEQMIHDAVHDMIGEQQQMPPAFSAKYVNGHRAYHLARNGEKTELKAAKVSIYDAKVLRIKLLSGEKSFESESGYADQLGRQVCPPYGTDAEHNTFRVTRWKPYFQDNVLIGEEPVPFTVGSPLTPAQIAQLPVCSVFISCSKGTYIRSAARDFGARLGSGAFMSALRRVASGGFRVENALDPQEYFVF